MNWASQDIAKDDTVVINSGVIVTLSATTLASEDMPTADSLEINGTLQIKQGTIMVDPMNYAPLTLSETGKVTVGATGSIVVDGTAYEGIDGYFPLIRSDSLVSSLPD